MEIAKELIRKSGVREWTEIEAEAAIGESAVRLATYIYDELSGTGSNMALPDYLRLAPATAKVIRSSGGDVAITLASLANGNGTSAGARQAATLDLGASWGRLWRIRTSFELAPTPTAGNAINLYGSFHSATGAGQGNTSGSDAAYTGYSNNIDAAAKHLDLLGAHICTAQATATVQIAHAGIFMPKGRYLNLVVDNRSGAAFHSTETNQFIELTPLEDKIEDT